MRASDQQITSTPRQRILGSWPIQPPLLPPRSGTGILSPCWLPIGCSARGFYMLPSTLPAYVKQIGGSNFEASLVIGTFSIMSLLSRIFSSAAVDALGEKPLTFWGIVVISGDDTLVYLASNRRDPPVARSSRRRLGGWRRQPSRPPSIKSFLNPVAEKGRAITYSPLSRPCR